MTKISRRNLMASTAAALAASAVPGTAARAAAPLSGRQGPGIYRYRIGTFEITAINDGTWYRPLDDKLVKNAPFADVQKALSDQFLPTDTIPIPFTALMVNTGATLVLLDTGTGGQLAETAGTMAANMAAAGIDPKSIDAIAITHFHPDHINGIKTKDGAKVFPNAEIHVPAPEWAFWMDDARMNAAPEGVRGAFLNARRIFSDIAGEVNKFEPGKEIVPGITSIAAYGHTAGHTAFSIASGDQSMLYLGDTTNNPWLFVRNPEWQAVFDADGTMAVDTRKRLLDRASADRMIVHGFHFPFPGSGYIAKTAKGYDLVPVMWRPQPS